MQSSFSLCDLPWWAVLLSWLIPALLGYLWGMLQWSRYKAKSKKAEIGKWADIIVLNQDLFNIDRFNIYKTRVLKTFFKGKLVHEE